MSSSADRWYVGVVVISQPFRGFWLIQVQDHGSPFEVFLHCSGLANQGRHRVRPKLNDRVKFQVVRNPRRGYRAHSAFIIRERKTG